MTQALKIEPHALERRRHQRVKVVLFGRYMLEDRQEYPCQTVDASPGGIALFAPVKGRIGERVVIYLEQLGRVEGLLVRDLEHGFAIALSATKRKQDKLANQLTWLANRHELGMLEDRRHERVPPRNSGVIVRLPNGREISTRVMDISVSGAGLLCSEMIPVGAQVKVGDMDARVVRHIEDGIAVEFTHPIAPPNPDEPLDI